MTFKKVSALFLVLAMMLTFTACDEDENITIEDPGASSDSDVSKADGKDDDNTAFDIHDIDSYFVKVDGEKLTVGDTIQSVLDKGFHIKEKDLSVELEPNYYNLCNLYNEKDEVVMIIYPYNAGSSSKPTSECKVAGFNASQSTVNRKGITITAIKGLTFGSTVSEVEAIFGKCEDIYHSDDDYMKYSYKAGDYSTDGSFDFIFFDGKTVSDIAMQNMNL